MTLKLQSLDLTFYFELDSAQLPKANNIFSKELRAGIKVKVFSVLIIKSFQFITIVFACEVIDHSPVIYNLH